MKELAAILGAHARQPDIQRLGRRAGVGLPDAGENGCQGEIM
jgi:hypothetical protein